MPSLVPCDHPATLPSPLALHMPAVTAITIPGSCHVTGHFFFFVIQLHSKTLGDAVVFLDPPRCGIACLWGQWQPVISIRAKLHDGSHLLSWIMNLGLMNLALKRHKALLWRRWYQFPWSPLSNRSSTYVCKRIHEDVFLEIPDMRR